MAAYGIAGRIHFLAERISRGVGADRAEALKLACHFGYVNGGHGSAPDVMGYAFNLTRDILSLARIKAKAYFVAWPAMKASIRS